MYRNDFINYFETLFQNNNHLIHFNVDVQSYSDKEEFSSMLFSFFSPIFLSIGIPSHLHDSFIKNMPFSRSYDAYYEENNPYSEICRFNCLLNLHELYDYYSLFLQHVLSQETPLTTIYRIEHTDKSHSGLYSSRFAAKEVNLDIHPSPYDDINFVGIFQHDNSKINQSYKQQWHFGFATIFDAQNWFNYDDSLDKLKQEGFCLKEITIPFSFVIEGTKQIIFKPAHIVSTNILDLLLLVQDVRKTFKY